MDPINKFVEENSKHLYSGAIVKKSHLGGFGIFATTPINDGETVLRVPHDRVFDIHTLQQLRNVFVEADTLGTVKEVLRIILQLDFEILETVIIWCYLCAFVIIRNDTNVQLSNVEWIDSYLDVLLSTETLDIDESVLDSLDALVLEVKNLKASVRKSYDELVGKYPDTTKLLRFEEAFQLFQAIRSRVLEIPCEIEAKNNEPEVKQSEDSDTTHSTDNIDDFQTNISLVPVLDFANHSFENNAVFDVDRTTKDVLLRVIKPVKEGDEITICYSPITEDMSPRFMNLFFTSYGFLPNRGYFSWHMEHLNTVMNEKNQSEFNDYQKIAQWLRVPLELNLEVHRNGNVTANLGDSIFPLLFIPDLKYNADWRLCKDKIFEELSSKAEGSADEFVMWLEEQESTGEPIYGIDVAYGVLFEGEPVVVDNVLSQTGCLSDEAIDALELLAMRMILEIIGVTIQSVPEVLSRMLQQYFHDKNDILKRFLS